MAGLTPPNILPPVMRQKWRENHKEGAVSLAKLATPDLHAKTPTSRAAANPAGVSDDGLERFERIAGAASAGENPGESA